jgi:hypothetical protein
MKLSEVTTKKLKDNPDGLFFYSEKSNQIIFIRYSENGKFPSWTIVDYSVSSDKLLLHVGTTSDFILFQTSQNEIDEKWQETYYLIDDYIMDTEVTINKRKSLIDAII